MSVKMKIYGLIAIVTFFLSCKVNRKEFFDGEYRIIGQTKQDSIWDGPMEFYDLLSNKLVAVRTYKDGLLSGPSVRYNDSGRIIDSANFIIGRQAGYNYVYNDAGQILQKKNFFYGRHIGDSYTYKNGDVIEYTFENFENKILYYYSYDPKTKEYYFADDDYFLNSFSNEVTVDGVDGVTIFTYVIVPPKLRMKYRIYKYDALNRVTDSCILPFNNFYFEKFFPVKSDKEIFEVHINKYDSVHKTETLIVNKIKTHFP